MLMLVVVIIIAAIVSAFAGGLANNNQKSSQVSISGAFSQTKGFQLYHEGGDTLSTENIKIFVRISDTMKSSAMYTWQINNSVLSNQAGTKFVVNPLSRSFDIPTFGPGDVLIVSPANLQYMQHRPDETSDYMSSYYGGLGVSGNIGKNFEVEIVDNRGKTIATTTIMIKG